jgi:acid phosphatase type 7
MGLRIAAALALLTSGLVRVGGEAPAARVSSPHPGAHPHETSLRGGAWTHHNASDLPPCGFFTSRSPCRFITLESDEQLVTQWGQRRIKKRAHAVVFGPFEDPLSDDMAKVKLTLSKDELYQLNTVDLDFTTPQGFAVHKDDWIGVFCHEDPAKPSPDNQYIDWQWVNASTPLRDRPRTRRFTFGPMVNMRCAWQFRYFAHVSDNTPSYARVGESHLLRFALGNGEPLHVRLSSTTSPTEMRVMWVSGSVQDAYVQFGEDPQKLSRRVGAKSDTYEASDMCQSPSTIVDAQHFRDAGRIFDAVMTELQPDRDYYYRVGSVNGVMSRVFKFRVPPPPGHHPEGSVMSFFMYADLGEWTSAATGLSPPIRSGTTMELVSKELETSGKNYVAVFHDGDLSYARGMAFQWDQFGALIEPVASRIPYMVSVGNHGLFSLVVLLL